MFFSFLNFVESFFNNLEAKMEMKKNYNSAGMKTVSFLKFKDKIKVKQFQ